MNMDKYFMWINYERLHNHNKAMHNKTVGIFLGIYCKSLAVDGQHEVAENDDYENRLEDLFNIWALLYYWYIPLLQ